MRKNISAGNSIIHAYATFFFLSFSILTYISFNLLSTTDVYNRHGTVTKRVVVYDPRIESFGHEHLYRMQLQPCYFLFCLVLCQLTFSASTQQDLVSGVNGGCDFRFVSGAPMLLAQILELNFISYVFEKPVVLYVGVPVVAAVLSVGVGYVKPCKSLFMNLSTSFHLGIVCLSGGVIALWFYGGTMINSRFLASAITMLAILPHLVALITIVVWILYRIRWLREALKKILKWISRGDLDRGMLESLPHRLIDSNAYT